MKKLRSYGTHVLPAGVRYIDRISRTGQIVRNNEGTYPALSRRIGTSSTIITFGGNNRSFRPCSHTVEKYVNGPVPSSYGMSVPCPPGSQLQFNTAYFGVNGFAETSYVARYPLFISGINSTAITLGAMNWDSLSQQALQSMLPSFRTDLSLLNAILELKDFKKLGTALVDRFKGRSTSIWDKILGIRLGSNPQEKAELARLRNKPLRTLSQMFLSYNFAWKPLYNDIQNFITALTGFDRQMKWLIANAGRTVTRRYQTRVAGSAFSGSTLYSGEGGGYTSWTGNCTPHSRYRVRVLPSEGILYSATCRLRWKIPPELKSAAGKAKAFLDALGVARDPAILWNAIPFSFIVDWFVDVGGFLQGLRLDNVPIQTEILEFCHSGKVERHIVLEQAKRREVCLVGYNSWSRSWLDYYISDTCIKSHYERRVGLPNFRLAISTSGLSLMEFLLGGALLSSRGGNR